MLRPLLSVLSEAEALIRRSYPPFVYGSGLAEDVPVFVFHETPASLFEARLRYLAENGYRTITADELCAHQQRRQRLPERAVLLAIDDGEQSVWQHAFPLLCRYGMQATLFVIAGYVSSRPVRKAPASQEPARASLVSWDELREMQASGHVDVQSHSLYHHQVFQSDRLEGFLDPYSDRDRFWDWRVPEGHEALVLACELAELGGLPVYRSDSMFRTLRRFRDDPEVREALVDETRRRGGRDFLRHEAGASRLLRERHRALTSRRGAGALAPPETTLGEIEHDLRESRERIEAELGKPVHHLCFPYNSHCAEARERARRAGYVSSFVGLEPAKRTNAPGGDPFLTVRLKHDYLPRLPGQDRGALAGIFIAKARARCRGSKVS